MATGSNDPQPNGPLPTGPCWDEIGDANIPTALLSLCAPLPEILYCPFDVATGRFLFRKLEATEDCGLVAFVDPQEARSYIEVVLPWTGYRKVRQLYVDDARDLALARHAVVNCLLVIHAHPWYPTVHFLR